MHPARASLAHGASGVSRSTASRQLIFRQGLNAVLFLGGILAPKGHNPEMRRVLIVSAVRVVLLALLRVFVALAFALALALVVVVAFGLLLS